MQSCRPRTPSWPVGCRLAQQTGGPSGRCQTKTLPRFEKNVSRKLKQCLFISWQSSAVNYWPPRKGKHIALKIFKRLFWEEKIKIISFYKLCIHTWYISHLFCIIPPLKNIRNILLIVYYPAKSKCVLKYVRLNLEYCFYWPGGPRSRACSPPRWRWSSPSALRSPHGAGLSSSNG